MDKRVDDTAFEAASSSMRSSTELARQILPSSGTMIGICTTLIGLVKIAEGRIGPSQVDVYVALLGATFLASAILSYMSMRMVRRARFSLRCARAADVFFLTGLTLVVAIIGLFALEQI